MCSGSILTGCYSRSVFAPLGEQGEKAGEPKQWPQQISEQQQQVEIEEQIEETEELIGGQRDEYGCLGPAGYSWDEEAGACLREWEIKNDGSRQAINIAVEYLGWSQDATVIEAQVLRCPGCFIVKLERNSTRERKTVNLRNWEIGDDS